MKKFLWIFASVTGLTVFLFGFVNYYSYIMSKDVVGTVTGIERLNSDNLILSGGKNGDAVMFSFAVSIKTKLGQIFTSSAEDRQWAVVKENQCVRARFYPYPFWNLEKSGTYFNARLIEIIECESR